MLLYTYPENFRAFKALIAAQFSGANIQIAPNFEFGKTNQTPEFLKKFPLGKVSIIKCLLILIHL
jgi:elongation factor 1-gamma